MRKDILGLALYTIIAFNCNSIWKTDYNNNNDIIFFKSSIGVGNIAQKYYLSHEKWPLSFTELKDFSLHNDTLETFLDSISLYVREVNFSTHSIDSLHIQTFAKDPTVNHNIINYKIIKDPTKKFIIKLNSETLNEFFNCIFRTDTIRAKFVK